MKAPTSLDVGDRLAGQSTLDQVAEPRTPLRLHELAVAQIEIHPGAPEREGEQMLRIGSGFIETELGKALGGPVQELAHGPALGAAWSRRGAFHPLDKAQNGMPGKCGRGGRTESAVPMWPEP